MPHQRRFTRTHPARYLIIAILASCTGQRAPAPPAPEDSPANKNRQTADHKVSSRDHLAPTSRAENARTKALHTITVFTADAGPHLAFFGRALGLKVIGPVTESLATRTARRQLWGLPDEIDWRLYRLGRFDVPGVLNLHLVELTTETPHSRTTRDRRQPGPYAIGFPADELVSWEREVRALGYRATTAEMMRYPIPTPDGGQYEMHETIFEAPDNLHAVLLSRQGMSQPGSLDPRTGRGGPAYATLVVRDSDAMIRFFVEVLGLELRSDREWGKGEKAYRFAILYAMGASSGHLLLLDYRDHSLAPAVPPRPPHRGMAVLSFPVRDIDETRTRLRHAGITPMPETVSYMHPEVGEVRAIGVHAPNGALIELFEPTGPNPEP
ncbi:MAG: VOC family protein [Myxococcota bacterium]